MKLIHANGRFEAVSSFEEKNIPKSAGFSWDPGIKRWVTNSFQVAMKLKLYADVGALEELGRREKELQKDLAASHAATSDLTVPAPAGLDYLPYQKAGIGFALSKKSCLIADEMGLGKTMQALGIINASPAISRVAIIVPAGLRLNWQKEAAKWIIRKDLPINRWKAGLDLQQPGILIVGYEEATKLASNFDQISLDLVICDEAHYLKNGKAKRTKAILGGKDFSGLKADKWVFLTGTPILNKPVELWTLVKKVDPHGLGASWVGFVKRYCDASYGKWGWEVDGASNLEELNEKLRLAGMIRRTKDQVLPDLPAKRRTLLPFEPDSKAKKLIKEQLKKQLAAKKAIRKAKSLERQNKEVFAADIQKLRADADVAFEDIARMRHELALLKVPQVAEFVQNAAESHPVIAFAHHKDVIFGIASSLKDLKVATITGDDTSEERQATVEAFQAGTLDCLVCSIKAAGVGLTMTRSSHVIFGELDWTPGWMQQAEDRAHRIGQKSSVLVDWLVLDGSLEAKMAKTLMKKMAITAAATGDSSPTEEATPTPAIPMASSITEEDFARAKENEAVAEQLEKDAEECREISRQIPEGRYALEIDGIQIAVVLKRGTASGLLYEIGNFDKARLQILLKTLATVDLRQAQFQYGRITGKCCKCGRELSDPLSKELGIGPDCGAAEHAAAINQKEAA